MFPFPSYFGLSSNPSNGVVVDGGFVQVQGGIISSMEMMPVNDGISVLSSTEAKAVAACKSHSEAERRRRERINGHLATLRTLLPNTTKTDKASLLAEVVKHVKDLKKIADDVASDRGCREYWSLPGEADELTLDYCDGEAKLIRASVCCEDRPELVRDLTRALRSVEGKVRVVKAEIGTVGGRTKSVIVVKRRSLEGEREVEGEDLLGELRRVLKDVVDKSALSGSAQKLPGNKRSRRSR
ncbi:transcription factor bHLH30-like [Macadamia integrifolia]|uniref:transcription factor bHLH30-like n=1 Tax=Macadamia integrifolia TaxID=60698 RepID=UPI001C4ED52F|nr:transcription factor bHLH30-like [Macadamia integrifolia]XP_042499015.1 transcription factor bHLH30-like [Macadamia integrifolia]XP_042499016.1 transcription factor bHLH30-like [Macadamia integrifolia]